MHKAFAAAKTRKEPFAKRMQRSYMNSTAASQFFAACVADGSQAVGQPVKTMVQDIFMIGQTKLVEDAWQRLRSVEKGDNDNSRISNIKRWLVPVKTKVASEVRHCPEVRAAGVPALVPGDPVRTPRTVYLPLRSQTSVDMKGVVGRHLKTQWQTFSPLSSLIQHSDMAAMMHYFESGEWHRATLAWLSLCMMSGSVVKEPGQPWALSLGDVRGVGTLTWPLDEVIDNARTFFVPRAPGSLHWPMVDDVSAWECQRTAWRSPLHMHASTSGGSWRPNIGSTWLHCEAGLGRGSASANRADRGMCLGVLQHHGCHVPEAAGEALGNRFACRCQPLHHPEAHD